MPRDPEKQREARRRYYYKNKDVYRRKNMRKYRRLQEYLREAKDVPCADCGKRYPSFVLDFDHREDKEFNVGRLVSFGSWKRLLGEIAKCDVVCANCHRERTHQRRLAEARPTATLQRVPLPGSSVGRTPVSGTGCRKFESSPGSEQLSFFCL